MKLYQKSFLIALAILFSFSGCSSDDAAPPETEPLVELNSEINDFVWQGLNAVYLYKADVPNLANSRFPSLTSQEYYQFLNSYSAPEDLFDALLSGQDRFSIIVDNYIELENSFSGNTNTNGLEFGLAIVPNTANDVFGFVRYVVNGSDASTKDIKRGELFTHVDGQQLNRTNFLNLLFGQNNNYTLGMATYNGSRFSLNGKTVALTKNQFTENPVHLAKTIDHNGTKVGYIMYNAFIGEPQFDTALNTAFGQLKSDGATELVLDLRYNGGGSVQTAIWLGSMITGQFNGDIYAKYRYNAELQQQFEAQDPEDLILRFTNTMRNNEAINSLNLSKLYVLVTDDTASASELIINGLKAYIDVVTIGQQTVGKSQASITIYDSQNLGREGANPNHTYAMQPLIITTINSKDEIVPNEGFVPRFQLQEEFLNFTNLGTLGDPAEPFLAEALNQISGGGTTTRTGRNSQSILEGVEKVNSSVDFKPFAKEMYIENPFNKQ